MKNTIGKMFIVASASFALAACSAVTNPGPGPYDQPEFAPEVVTSSAPVVPPAPVNDAYGSRVLNERDNLVKEIGQAGGIFNASNNEVFVDFKVTKISDKKCKAKDYPSENGKFIAVEMAITTKNDPEDQLGGVIFDYGWESVNADGVSVAADTSPAAVCASDLPSDDAIGLKPNRKYTKTLILDVQKDVDVISWSTFLGQSGWEWKV